MHPLILAGTGLAGLLISFYIHHKKSAGGPMVCPVGATCDQVTHSEYSKFFGIPLEYLGMLYYGLTVIGYSAAASFPGSIPPLGLLLLYAASLFAFLFSIYLTFIQAFVLREYCSWCLTSASLSTAILAGTIVHSGAAIQPLLEANYGWIVAIHVMAAALGWGTANVSDVFFLRFLRDRRISEEEGDVLGAASQIIWFALILIIGSGIALLGAKPDLAGEAAFIVKMVVVAVLIVNGAVANLLVAPKLIEMHFGSEEDAPGLKRLRRMSFTGAAVSLASWYFAFVLQLSNAEWSLPVLLQAYGAVLLTGLVAGRVLELKLTAQKN